MISPQFAFPTLSSVNLFTFPNHCAVEGYTFALTAQALSSLSSVDFSYASMHPPLPAVPTGLAFPLEILLSLFKSKLKGHIVSLTYLAPLPLLSPICSHKIFIWNIVNK